MTRDGHYIVLEDDESYETDSKQIPRLSEKVITSAVPNSKVKFIYMPEEDAKKLAEKHKDYNGFGDKVENVFKGFPWTNRGDLVANGMPEILVLAAEGKDMTSPRYKSMESFNRAVYKAKNTQGHYIPIQ
jgi:hypothetical protein